MCGFVGIALTASGAAPTEARLAAMCDTIVHRGPDDRGILTRAPFGVGFQRLSIIDLAGGHQPIFNETGDVAVVCNGELYGFRELREDLIALGHRFRTGSDVEVLVHLYEEYGERLVDRLVGMFAFAVFDWRDARRPKLLLGRDRLGIKPLYWSCDDEGLRFASEAKAILADGGPRRLRTTALLDYLVLGYVTGEEGAWEGIRRLPPGHLLSWSPGESPRLRRYWNLPLDGPRAAADDDEILEWVDRAVGDEGIQRLAERSGPGRVVELGRRAVILGGVLRRGEGRRERNGASGDDCGAQGEGSEELVHVDVSCDVVVSRVLRRTRFPRCAQRLNRL